MIQRIVCILIVVLLQMAATSCSATKQSAHTVCPEPTMTLSDDNADRHCDSAPSASDLMTHQKAGLTQPATETFAAQSRTQARTKPHTGTHKPLAMATLVALRRADAHSCRQPPARRQQRRAVTNLRHRHPVYGLCLCHTPHHHLADSLFFYKLKLVTVSLRLRDTILLSN